MATIEFWGVMLFVLRGGVVTEVVFPDTNLSPPGGKAGKHYDGCDAKQHYPGVIHVRADKTEKLYDLTDAQVSFAGGTHLMRASAFADVADISSLSSSGSLRLKETAPQATRISLRFPVKPVPTFEYPDEGFTLPGKSAPCPLVTRVFVDGEVTISMLTLSGSCTLRVKAGETAIFHHADEPGSTVDSLRKRRTVVPDGNKIFDHDFKWLYALTIPAPGDDGFQDNPLPAPESSLLTASTKGAEAMPHPSVSTCFPGRIGS